jgi:hypothetical protein
MVIEPNLLGELILTTDEHEQITKLVRPYPDGTLPPGFVTLVVDRDDRLGRFHDGVSRVLYTVHERLEMLCIAAIHTAPVVDVSGEHTHLSRHCYKGPSGEWWIVLPGGKLMYITPKEPLRVGKDVVVVLEVILQHGLQVPQLLVPYREDRMDVSVMGAD